MADETALAVAADDTDKARLLCLLREHLTLTMTTERWSGGVSLTVALDFDGEPIATDFVTITT
ncbi:hypothetical protein [Methylobacterium sp. WL120]|uniref:hypothetical protein n=1 Tax=Methylobacterium sp. WL120 TaxID=2603887 RepID=UPI0011CA19E3|nr:hypothetical protein [Methylobacterium sp. WL120]TXM69674.1 hypothetical protein FV229_04835 [Methylobacterium sp. WL120]